MSHIGIIMALLAKEKNGLAYEYLTVYSYHRQHSLGEVC